MMLEQSVGPIDPRSELLLMVASRAQHCAERIVPALESGRDVVCDRFSGSTIAYQGFGRGLPVAEVASACALATAGLDADLTVLLDVSLDVASTRRSRPLDAIESQGDGFHERVRGGFLELARSEPQWVVVNGEGSVSHVADEIRAIVAARLGSTPS